MIKFATVRLGKTSVEDIKRINSFSSGIISNPTIIPVVCTQVPIELEPSTIIFLWFGSDNAKGMPTEWKQGFKAVGTVVEIDRGASFNSETTTKIRIEYIFAEAINRLDILREASSAYYNCANLPIIGIDDHSNQTIRVFDGKQKLSDTNAFLYALNKVRNGFKVDICKIHPELADLFSYYDRNNNMQLVSDSNVICNQRALQKIFYGAPGTGKSHTIKEQTKAAEGDNRVFRTTFHPDSDYATFVGCYKPAMEPKEPIYKSAELINKLTLIKNSGVSYPCHKFAAKYWESLKELSANEIKAIVNACGFTDSMTIEVQKGQAIGEEIGSGSSQKQIVYRFIPQVFTNAYIRAWQTNEPVYLIIEEINRGNCAQIFGDLFQLLDRDERGFSKYPIIPDTDLGNYIHEQLASTHRDDAWAALIQGKEMELPDNLYIWASMNTSDQSLFPIDSAFKRRWDWEYVPIQDAGKDYKIKVNGSVYDWWEFVQAINKEVLALTHSEDKQLGYFFVRPANGIIDANMLVNKVYFYLWNDVFKDYEIDGQKAFKKPDAEEAIAFKDFFEGGLDEKLAEQVLQNLELGEEIQAADE